MGYQDEQVPLDDAERLPALFAVLDAHLLGERERVSEYSHGDIKTDRVLAQINGCLGRISFKPHNHIIMLLHISMYGHLRRRIVARGAID